MAPRTETLLAPEDVAQLRHIAQIIFAFKADLERRDSDLVALLSRVVTLREHGDVRQADPDVQAALIWDSVQSDVAGLAVEVRRLAAIVEREPLVSEGFVIQSNEILRNLRADIHKAPALNANATAIAVGGALQGMIDAAVTKALAAIVPEILATIPEVVAAAQLAVLAPLPPVPAEPAPVPACDPMIIVDIDSSPAPRKSRRKTA